ncbi:MAG: hypothetical protein AAF725_15200 [Acidobacteriota bacterium]
MKCILVLPAILLACPAIAQVATSSEPAQKAALAKVLDCRGEENDIARLACFDAAAVEIGELHPAPADGAEETAVAEEEEPAPEPKKAAALPFKPRKTYPRTVPTRIIEADEGMVEGCDFLGTVAGKSGWGGLAANTAMKGATRSAKKRAAKLGATRIVVGNFRNGNSNSFTSLQARAYWCPES